MTRKKDGRMNLKIAIAVVLVLSLLGLIGVAIGNLGDNLVYYWTPTELKAAGDKAFDADVRLGGMVKADSIDWNKDTQKLSFVVFTGEDEVTVHGEGLPPQMFREGIGVVVEGQLQRDGVFRSDRLLVKHDNEYRAPGDERVDMQAMMETVEGSP